MFIFDFTALMFEIVHSLLKPFYNFVPFLNRTEVSADLKGSRRHWNCLKYWLKVFGVEVWTMQDILLHGNLSIKYQTKFIWEITKSVQCLQLTSVDGILASGCLKH